jgi:hypothetical protein
MKRRRRYLTRSVCCHHERNACCAFGTAWAFATKRRSSEVGEQLDVSRERVRQMESKALRMMSAPSRRSRLISRRGYSGRWPVRVAPAQEAVTQQSVGIRPAPQAERYGPPRPPKEPEAKKVNRRVSFPAPYREPPVTTKVSVTMEVSCPHCGTALYLTYQPPLPSSPRASCAQCLQIFQLAA